MLAVTGSPAARAWSASSSRAAALPVGAARATSGRWVAEGCGLLDQQRDHLGDGRGLPRARPAGDHGQPPPDRTRRGAGLVAVGLVPGEEADEALPEDGLVDARGRCVAVGRAEGDEVRCELALLPPGAIEVEARAEQAQRKVGASRLLADGGKAARADGVRPPVGLGPGERREIHRDLGLHGGGVDDRREVDVDVAQAGGADGEREGQERPLVLLPRELAEAPGDVEVRGVQHAREVEGGEQPARSEREPGVERVPLGLGRRRGHKDVVRIDCVRRGQLTQPPRSVGR